MSDNVPRSQQIIIKVDGVPLSPELMLDLIEAEIEATLHLPSMFTLRFHDSPALEWTDGNYLKVGGRVEIELNKKAGGQMINVMKGEITAIEPEFSGKDITLTVRGYDYRHRLIRGTKTRVFIQATDADIVKKIGAEFGLRVMADPTSQVHEHVFQHNLSDLAFLQQRAQRIGFEVYVDDKTLHFRKSKNAQAIQLKWGEDMHTFRPRMTLSKQVNEVSVRGWDPKQKREIIGTANNSSTSPVVGGATWGGAEAKKAFQAAKHVEVRRPVRTQDEAVTVAQAIIDDINAGFVQAEGIAFGNPDLLAGLKVKIDKVGTRFGGTYLLTSTRHIYADGNFDTYFTVEGKRPFQMDDGTNGLKNPGNLWGGVVVGLVTNNNDPQKQGRVKLKFPWLDDQLESNWARVCATGAGKGMGIHWLPEVNDEVLVAFEHGDFNYPYVLGGLWNGKDAPPEANAVQSGKVEIRTFKTRAGHIIRLTDGPQKSIEIIDADNSTSIKLDTQSKKVTVVSQGDISLEANSGNIELKGKSIKIQGSSDVTVNGTSKVDVKGGMVNIN
jgi:phage protein D/phage baseplate assembly protein gpV